MNKLFKHHNPVYLLNDDLTMNMLNLRIIDDKENVKESESKIDIANASLEELSDMIVAEMISSVKKDIASLSQH